MLMHRRIKLALVAVVSALVLATMISTSSAKEFSIPPARDIRATFAALTYFEASGLEVICPATLEGTFHESTIRKVLAALIGYFTRLFNKTEDCTAMGTVRLLPERLPWHITYSGYTGTLPNVSLRLTFHLVSFRTEVSGIQCLYRGQARSIVSRTATNTIMTFEEGLGTTRAEGPALFCSNLVFIRGPGSVTRHSTATLIVVRLI